MVDFKIMKIPFLNIFKKVPKIGFRHISTLFPNIKFETLKKNTKKNDVNIN